MRSVQVSKGFPLYFCMYLHWLSKDLDRFYIVLPRLVLIKCKLVITGFRHGEVSKSSPSSLKCLQFNILNFFNGI